MANIGLTRIGGALLGPGVQKIKATPTPPKPPPPPPPNTNVQWDLYSAYPPGPEWPYSQAVPTSQEPSKGYDVEVTRLQADRRAALMNKANSQLLDGPNGYTYSLFVQAVNMDMSLVGSYGQSQYTRDFYARNFVQPSISVVGQSPTQEDYGILCEFVHSCQHKAVANGYQNLTQLFVVGRDTTQGLSGRGFDGTLTDSSQVVLDQPGNLMPGYQADPPKAPRGTFYSQHIRGAHQPLLAKGYISSMPRIHKQFEYCVQWTLVFTIAAMLQGPFRDTVQALPNKAPTTWLNMLQDIQSTGVVSSQTPGLVKKNQQIVRAASAATINPVTPANATSGSSTPAPTGKWQSALLTWYDPALGGTNSSSGVANPTADMANGQPYDASADTCAADPKYPFGTQVTFQYNGKSITCTVTDRGGAITGSHFDLSRAAASTLGIISAGSVTAQFQVV